MDGQGKILYIYIYFREPPSVFHPIKKCLFGNSLCYWSCYWFGTCKFPFWFAPASIQGKCREMVPWPAPCNQAVRRLWLLVKKSFKIKIGVDLTKSFDNSLVKYKAAQNHHFELAIYRKQNLFVISNFQGVLIEIVIYIGPIISKGCLNWRGANFRNVYI